ncbi:MAG: ABC transporter ATP-binding protein [Spirochaetia bacterium]|nr:ABC transporter ATP-binding protein [Spirochaetia bacterium]
MTDYAVLARKVSVGKALCGINLRVKRGEFVTILGSNGAGKTTLLKALLSFSRIDSGEASVMGVSVKMQNRQAIMKKAGYLPQHVNVDRDFPMLAGEAAALSGIVAHRAAKRMELDTISDKPFGRLSGGERKKVLLALALSRSPEVLLLDEPGNGLDPYSYAEMCGTLEMCNKRRGLTVLFVTHLLSRIPAACGRVIALKEGRIVYDGKPGMLHRNKKLMEKIYG